MFTYLLTRPETYAGLLKLCLLGQLDQCTPPAKHSPLVFNEPSIACYVNGTFYKRCGDAPRN